MNAASSIRIELSGSNMLDGDSQDDQSLQPLRRAQNILRALPSAPSQQLPRVRWLSSLRDAQLGSEISFATNRFLRVEVSFDEEERVYFVVCPYAMSSGAGDTVDRALQDLETSILVAHRTFQQAEKLTPEAAALAERLRTLLG